MLLNMQAAIGLFLTPVFYVGLRKLSGRKLIQHGEASLSRG
jgi:multidrug efflux pump